MKKFGNVTNIEKDSYFTVIKLESQGIFPFGRLVIIFFGVHFIHKDISDKILSATFATNNSITMI
jgi:hypothetical protein